MTVVLSCIRYDNACPVLDIKFFLHSPNSYQSRKNLCNFNFTSPPYENKKKKKKKKKNCQQSPVVGG